MIIIMTMMTMPAMMLTLLIYCYATGRFGSRTIEAATHSDVAVRYVCANHHPRMKDASLPHRATFGQGHTRLEHRARPDPGTTLDHAKRADHRVLGHPSARVDDRGGMNARAMVGLLGLLPQTGQSRKVHIRVVGHDDGTPLTGLSFKNGRHDHATGLTCSELDTVFGVAEETDLVGPGRMQGGQASDHPIGVTAQTPAKSIN